MSFITNSFLIFIIDITEEEKAKRDEEIKSHYITEETLEQKLVVLDSQGEPYNGDCWPGNSVWIDYLNLKAQEYFSQQYLRDEHLQKNPHVHIKNDMNEPSVFNPILECTMPKNNIHTVHIMSQLLVLKYQ